ncbi:MAG: SUMF1/EgtB/PvdO family nonheme iron enzyme [Bacteroidales bacterium]|nr:SUMF1/EgtB/PvdO family nonheme iron enzyme [Bacteroidales bacterium]
MDGGYSFGSPVMTHVSGDVGKDVYGGNDRCIVWNVLQDCTELKGDRVCFKVIATGQAAASPATGTGTLTFKVGNVSFDMIKVEAGSFTMGCTSEQGGDCFDDEKPSHRVTITQDYYIGKFEVTQELWQAVMGTTVRQQRDLANKSWSLRGEGGNYPMYYVSWEEAQEFCAELSRITGRRFTLPTEAEWEYAARGGQKSTGAKYSGSSSVANVAWYDGNSGSQTHPVGTKRPNELGIYDMSGNVWEWCQDWYGKYSSASQTDPTGPSSGSGRVFRGGGWDNSAKGCRVVNRDPGTLSCRSSDIGFRVVCVP